jgi:peptide/nickel transport system permease protein
MNDANSKSPAEKLTGTKRQRPNVGQLILVNTEANEGYFQLVWRRFRRSTISIIGGLMVLGLILLAIFAEFFATGDINKVELNSAFVPPQQVHFIDSQGKFHLIPFVYNYENTLDPATFEVTWKENKEKTYSLKFFVKSWEYKLLGFIPSRLHLIGVEEGGVFFMLGTDKMGRDLFGKACQAGRVSLSMSLFGTIISIAIGSVMGVVSGYYGGGIDNAMQRFVEFVNAFPQLPLWMALAALVPKTADSFFVFIVMSLIFALLSWTTLTREVRGKVLALRETDFILAAKEMGASDARIIFRHLYPNTLSHVIVILTLTVPGVILAESFLSFLGIGISEPLISWGLMMRNAQNIQTLGSNVWILSPVLFIVVAVLGFNFLGDGLRDAADPYATR